MSTLADLISRVRYEYLADDVGTEEEFRWKTPHIVNALNESQREIARRCLLIQDSSSDICSLTLAADINGDYPQSLSLSSKIIRVRYVLFPISTTAGYRELFRSSTDKINKKHGRWQWIGKKGRVEHFVTDFESWKLTFDHQPLYGGTVKIGVFRLPLVDMVDTGDPDNSVSPEIQEYDLPLIHGALKHLYMKGYKREDDQTYDPIKANTASKEFEADISKITQDRAAMFPQETVCQPEDW